MYKYIVFNILFFKSFSGFTSPVEETSLMCYDDKSAISKSKSKDNFKIPPEDRLCKDILSTFRQLVIETAMSLDMY